MKLKCIIVDDEFHNIKLLQNYVMKDAELDLIGRYSNPLEALAFANKSNPDIIFLDLNMPQLNGFEFMGKTTSTAKVILTTTLFNTIKKVDEFKISGYLLKPIQLSRFQKCLDVVKTIINTV